MQKGFSCMIMPISWQYIDVDGVIVQYIADHLDPTNYLLYFGIIAINELCPKVIIRFTLKELDPNYRRGNIGRFVWSYLCCSWDAENWCLVITNVKC